MRDYNLLSDLQGYGLNQMQANEILNECLADGYIIISNQKFSITTKGRRYLKNNELLSNYTTSAAKVFNPPKTVTIGKSIKTSVRKSIEFWGILIGIIGGLLTIYYLLFDHKVF